MPKRTDIKKILVIGSGPIVIGQAAEFDYAGAQACLALKEEGYQVVLINSNPATIMTDKEIADVIYMEPLTLEFVSKVIRKERPDGIIGTLGGQTGLNMTVQLHEKGILQECNVEILGTDLESINRAEDRKLFNELCEKIGEPILKSHVATTPEEAIEHANTLGYPIILRPAFTLGGTGGGFADNDEELYTLAKKALILSPVRQVLIEKSIKGYKEIEYEVIRDKNDTTIIVCNMENINPVGVHTGDSAVVVPSQTITNEEFQMLRNCSLNIVKELGIEGGCNVQLALDPHSSQYYVIEVNPRVSRSSALASKASGYPIARVSAKIACGYDLHEIKLPSVPASFEPTLDYVVTKLSRFPFDKFDSSDNKISTQMKATGEVMSVGRSFKESFLKSIRSLETGLIHFHDEKFDNYTDSKLLKYIEQPTDDLFLAVAELLRRGYKTNVIHDITKIDHLFLEEWLEIIHLEHRVKDNIGDIATLKEVKKQGFSDEIIAEYWNMSEDQIFKLRRKNGIYPVYKMIDVCASEFESYIPYFYSSYDTENESIITGKKKVIVLGSGPIRIGQGIEFDYSSVHAIKTLKKQGYEAIIINNNPETVSTDYTTSDKLYFEPLTLENVSDIIELEKPDGIMVQFGGQTAINLCEELSNRGYKILGTQPENINLAEDRKLFEELMNKLEVKQPAGKTTRTLEKGIEIANGLGYPVLVRPSFVLGGRAMEIVSNQAQLERYLKMAFKAKKNNSILIDKYLYGKEIEVDAVCDGHNIFIPGIMEHIEKTGVHSGDSLSVYPTFSISEDIKQEIIDTTRKIGIGNGIIGAFNIQFIVTADEQVYVIEVNPRSSRTNPFISKVTESNISDIATKVSLGITLKQQGITRATAPEPNRYFVKSPVFSNSKIVGIDARLGPEMKSTGEAIGIDNELDRALYKAFIASGINVKNYGSILISVPEKHSAQTIAVAKEFYKLGFNILATKGTAGRLKSAGIKTKVLKKLSESSEKDEILEYIRKGLVTYVFNIPNRSKNQTLSDGYAIRKASTDNNIPLFSSLDTMEIFIKVLKRITISVKPI